MSKTRGIILLVWLCLIITAGVYYFMLEQRATASNFSTDPAKDNLQHAAMYARQHLVECTPNEIELIWFDGNGYPATLQIDLTSKTLRCEGDVGDPNVRSTPAWGATFPGYYPPQLSDVQLGRVKELLAALPPSADEALYGSDDAYKKQYHLVFYKDVALQTRSYSKIDPPKEFLALLKFLCVDNYYQ